MSIFKTKNKERFTSLTDNFNFSRNISREFSAILVNVTHENNDNNIDLQWETMKGALLEAGKILQANKKVKKHDWMTDDILDLMCNRRQQKN